MGYLNPLLKLPAARGLLELDGNARASLAALMMALRREANNEAERAWKRRKGPMACYWRAVSTYARHIAHVLRRGEEAEAATAGDAPGPDVDRLQRDLDAARRQVAELVEAAKVALPEPWHPNASTPENWARQLRGLGRSEPASQLWLPLHDELPAATSWRADSEGPPARGADACLQECS